MYSRRAAGKELGARRVSFLADPTLCFYTKKTKYAASVITYSPSHIEEVRVLMSLSPKLLPEVPGLWRREGLKGWFSVLLPALPYISSWLLKCVATPYEGRNIANQWKVAVLERILLVSVWRKKRRRPGPGAVAGKGASLHGPHEVHPR